MSTYNRDYHEIFSLFFNVLIFQRPLRDSEKLPVPKHRDSNNVTKSENLKKVEKKEAEVVEKVEDEKNKKKKKEKKVKKEKKHKKKQAENDNDDGEESEEESKKRKKMNEVNLLGDDDDEGDNDRENLDKQSKIEENLNKLTLNDASKTKQAATVSTSIKQADVDDIDFWLNNETSTEPAPVIKKNEEPIVNEEKKLSPKATNDEKSSKSNKKHKHHKKSKESKHKKRQSDEENEQKQQQETKNKQNEYEVADDLENSITNNNEIEINNTNDDNNNNFTKIQTHQELVSNKDLKLVSFN